MENPVSPSTCSHEHSDFYVDPERGTVYDMKVCRDCREIFRVPESPPIPSRAEAFWAHQERKARERREGWIIWGVFILFIILLIFCWPWISAFVSWLSRF